MNLATRCLLVLGAVLALLGSSRPAEAHTLGLSRSEWRSEGPRVELRIELARADALAFVPAADSNRDGQLTEGEVAADGVARGALDGRVRVEAGGTACTIETASLTLEEEDGARLEARYTCGEGARTATLGGFFGALPAGHRQAAFVHGAEGPATEALLHAGAPTVDVGHPGARAMPASPLRVAVDYLVLGVEHIWFGIDHVVFLLGLVLVAARLRDVVAMATAFTVAHSLTLALAVLGIVAPSGAFIEPVIALSVAYVGIENLRGADPKTRWRVTAAFGLVHGFGFAGALAEVGLPGDRVPLALLSFNVGVELGQLAILAVVVPLLVRLRARAWFRERAVPGLSGLIVLVGLAWFVERVFL
jgi:hydrogenase/urease accessory protein HupE